ncbi:hypothetical protein [Clostridium sp.]|jgi:hypothetical protein|uniref:hypothetical protein n=1 Tax=Clostridium sp. TaxID=1506 RepID=UPI003EEF7088
MDLNKLRGISFSNVLKLKDQSIIPFYNYGYFKKLHNGHEISGYCTECEENGLNKVSDKTLSLMTYGTHTIDYIDYLDDPPLLREDCIKMACIDKNQEYNSFQYRHLWKMNI